MGCFVSVKIEQLTRYRMCIAKGFALKFKQYGQNTDRDETHFKRLQRALKSSPSTEDKDYYHAVIPMHPLRAHRKTILLRQFRTIGNLRSAQTFCDYNSTSTNEVKLFSKQVQSKQFVKTNSISFHNFRQRTENFLLNLNFKTIPMQFISYFYPLVVQLIYTYVKHSSTLHLSYDESRMVLY